MKEIPALKKRAEVITSVGSMDQGYALVCAVIHTLNERNCLDKLVVRNILPEWRDFPHETRKGKLPFLKIDEREWKSFDKSQVIEIYQFSGGNKIRDMENLNMWIRAWTFGAKSFTEAHVQAQNSEVLASLVERGGDILQALKN